MQVQKIQLTPAQTLRKVTLKSQNKRIEIREVPEYYTLMTMYDSAAGVNEVSSLDNKTREDCLLYRP